MSNDEIVIGRARHDAKELLLKLERATGDRRREVMADMLLRWLLTTSSGYLASDILEKAYLEIAQRITVQMPKTFEPSTCLFVMSEAGISGGHTRWIEQWIDCERSRKYSLVFTRPVANEIPGKLMQLIFERGGRVYCLGYDNRNVKAGRLRTLASNFESVILSPHMDDVVPLLAFGSTEFTRPIAFMNHANHMFWVGMSIADRIIDCGVWQQKVSIECRGASKTDILPWMQYETVPRPKEGYGEKISARKCLSLDPDRFVILTAAPAYKYRSVKGLDFTEVIRNALEACPNADFVIVGMSPSERPDWRELSAAYGNRLLIHSAVPLDELKTYCTAADLYVDSFPFTSGGTVGVARRCGCPALTICKDFNYTAWMRCDTVENLCRRIQEFYASPNELAEFRNITIAFEMEIASKQTRSYCQPILTQFMDDFGGMVHSLHTFTPKVKEVSTNDYTILATRYNKVENEGLATKLRILSIGSERVGFGLVHARDLTKRVCGRVISLARRILRRISFCVIS